MLSNPNRILKKAKDQFEGRKTKTTIFNKFGSQHIKRSAAVFLNRHK